MFHGEVEVFSEGVEEGEVGFCVIFVSERSAAVVNEMGVGLLNSRLPLIHSFSAMSGIAGQ